MAYSQPELAAAQAFHRRHLSLDSHVDLPAGSELIPLDGGSWPGQFDLPRARQGGLSGAALVLHAPPARPSAESRAAGKAHLEASFQRISALIDNNPESAVLARNPQDVEASFEDGKFAIMLAFQNAAPLEELADLDLWIDRGISLFAFTFIGNNQWADSARPYPFIGGDLRSDGLSKLGRSAVQKLNDRGVIVDISQLSSAALRDVLEISRAPVLASHSAVRAFVDADRNLDDDELRAVAAGGGVIQIVGFSPYLKQKDADRRDALRKVWANYGLDGPATIAESYSVNHPDTAHWTEDKFWQFLHDYHDVADLGNPLSNVADLADAIEHAIAVAGIDHVGIASDFNHGGGLSDWRDVADTLNVTAELLARGFDEINLAKLWGGNFLRVWQEVLVVGASPFRRITPAPA